MDWTQVDFGNILTIGVLGVTGLVAYFGWQRAVEKKLNELESSVERKLSALDRSFDGKFTALAIQINTIMMRDVANITTRIVAIETDEANMHRRFHQLADDVNGLGLKVDRLERPHTQ